MHWTPEADNEVARLMFEGLSATQIGDRMGVSRNAVIGRVHRHRERFGTGFARKKLPRDKSARKPVVKQAPVRAAAAAAIAVTPPVPVELPKPKIRIRRMHDIDLQRLFRETPELVEVAVIDARGGFARKLGIRSYVKEIVMRNTIDQRWSNPRPMPVSLPFVSILGTRT